MKFLKNKFNPKLLFSTIGTAILFFIGSTQYTHAQVSAVVGGVINSISSATIVPLASGIAYLLAVIFGIIIAIEAWFIGIVLNINASILQTTLVQTGFSISLSIANLAFVLGIIVIAVATILRNNTYGIKQLLWKLVVMAIIVNFGLVIMSPIFALGNSFTQYFLNCINPGSGGCTQSSSALTSFNNFGTTMAGTFNPGKAFVAPSAFSNAGSSAGGTNSGLLGSFGIGASVGQSVVPIFGILFVAIDMILIVIVLGGFIALMTVRYLYIAILAILLPFAWASWVFPSFSSHWKKWWENFIRWTFFAPLVLFFIYLALLTMKGVGGAFDVSIYQQGSGTVWSAFTTFLSNEISPVITAFLQEILLAGLIIGGMIAANSMGIKLAGTMVSAAEKGGKAVRGAAWNATKRRTTDRLRTMGRKTVGKETTTSLQRLGSRLQSVPLPGFKPLGSKIANTGSQEVFHEESKEKIKKYIDSDLKGLDNKGLLARANSKTAFINPTEAAAIGQQLAKRDLTASIDPDRMKKFLGVSERMGNVQSILNNRPELAAQTSAATPKTIVDPITGISRVETAIEAETRAITEATKKIKVADITDINHKSMGDHTGARASFPYDPADQQQAVALSMSPQQLRKLVTEGSDEQTKAFKDTIEKMMSAATTPGAAPLPPDVDDRLTKLHDYVNATPEWRSV